MNTIVASAQSRYSAKAFDPTQKLNEEQIKALKSILRLSPSSINIQAWHFIIATSEAAKAKIASACPGALTYNAEKIQDAAMVVILAARTDIDTTDVARVIEQEAADGRYVDEAAKTTRIEVLGNYIHELNKDPAKTRAWLDKQTYIALGNVLLAASDMGIDSVPIEGFHPDVIDKAFDLPHKGYHAVVLAAFGYHSDKDFNADLPKSRFPDTVLFTDC